jgi:hypothetical protein
MMDNFCWCCVVAAWPVMLRKRAKKVLFLNIEAVYVKEASKKMLFLNIERVYVKKASENCVVP